MSQADELLRELVEASDDFVEAGERPHPQEVEAVNRYAKAKKAARAYLDEKPHEPRCPTCDQPVLATSASPPHAAAEPEKPVAWLYRRHEGDENPIATVKRWEVHPYLETPLYAAVQQPIARDEFICARCGIRVDSTHDKGDF